MRKLTIALTATFTAEPIEDALNFWMPELGIESEVEFAPYNQVFQQLLDPASLLSRNQSGINVALVRFEDLLQFEDSRGVKTEGTAVAFAWENVERNVRDLALAMKSAAARSTTPLLICLCPASPSTLADAELAAFFNRMEEALVSEAKDMRGVYVVTTTELAALYPVASYADPHANKLGHVPYTQTLFAALGTVIARFVFSLQSVPYKVIALDCDGTLWKGVCGEDGPQGIVIDGPRRALQEFMVAQHDAGMLICLCSKNNEEDVVKVFEQRTEMPLKREHIIAWRLNWEPKSSNLRSLAAELKLGLDSFIFVDDDPVPCAEVEAHCPEVLTLRLPQAAEHIPEFLNHVWGFDRLKITEEDQQRTALYKQNAERERLLQGSLSFKDFLTGLNLEIQILAMQPHQLARVAQLTQRTNQFNCTTVRRSESEVQTLCQASGSECLVVEVSDRFGDYGLVGVLIFQVGRESIDVDTFLLSCRALGRGVEHRMLARLGEIARTRGLGHVNVPFVPSSKNRPALDFLQGVGANYQQPIDGGRRFQFPTEYAAGLEYSPAVGGGAESSDAAADKSSDSASPARSVAGTEAKSALISRIAMNLATAEQVHSALETQKRRVRPELVANYAAPRSSTEKMLAEIWSEVLGVDRLGILDNFFELGGHSLLATVLVSRVRDAFEVELSLADFFDAPTIAGLAGAIEDRQIEHADAEEVARMLKELDELSDEEVKALLADDGQLAPES